MRLLVIGANGLLGSNVVHAGEQAGCDVLGTYYSKEPSFDIPLVKFDLREYDSFDSLLSEYQPDVVINCAAMTDVDGCENSPEAAHILNGEAPGELAARCRASGVDFAHVSTDYVFDGRARERYAESSDPNPIQEYGASKLAGEQAVREELPDALITRLSFVWGIHRGDGELTGFPSWVRGQLESEQEVPLFTDQWVTPTRAGQAAEKLLEFIESDASGLYHLACSSCVTPYEFGEIIAKWVGNDSELLVESSVDDVDRDAARPTYSCLDVGRLESTVERAQPSLQEDVEAVADAFR